MNRRFCHEEEGQLASWHQVISTSTLESGGSAIPTWDPNKAIGERYEYTQRGEVETVFLHDVVGSANFAREVNYVYSGDRPGLPASIRHRRQGGAWVNVTDDSVDIVYNADGTLKSLTYGNGVEHSDDRDLSGSLLSRTLDDSSGSRIFDGGFTWNNRGYLTHYAIGAANDSSSFAMEKSLFLDYNSRDRLEAWGRNQADVAGYSIGDPWMHSIDTACFLEPDGNRLQCRIAEVFGQLASGIWNIFGDESYRFETTGVSLTTRYMGVGEVSATPGVLRPDDWAMSHDDMSRLQNWDLEYTDDTWAFQWGDRSQLDSVSKNGTFQARFYYGPSGRLIHAKRNTFTPFDLRVQYYYTGGSSTQLNTEMVEGPDEVRDYIYLRGEPIAMVVSPIKTSGSTPDYDGAEQTFFITTDHMGVPVMITDASEEMVWHWERDPYGEEPPMPHQVVSEDSYFSLPVDASYTNCSGCSDPTEVWSQTFDTPTWPTLVSSNLLNDGWSVSDVVAMRVRFSVLDVEYDPGLVSWPGGTRADNNDRVEIRDGSGNVIQVLYGDTGAGWSDWVSDNKVEVAMMTNGSGSTGSVRIAEIQYAVGPKLVMSLRFPGQVALSVEDLPIVYNGARWYNPRLGRFISPDPIPALQSGSDDRFDYAGGNPMMYVDPTGGRRRCARTGSPGNLSPAVISGTGGETCIDVDEGPPPGPAPRAGALPQQTRVPSTRWIGPNPWAGDLDP
ncbi:MAG: RHS repeat-associated core domain-containing protein, partial [Myxococcota bacterium]